VIKENYHYDFIYKELFMWQVISKNGTLLSRKKMFHNVYQFLKFHTVFHCLQHMTSDSLRGNDANQYFDILNDHSQPLMVDFK